eukprot:g39445.t1
MDRLCQVKREDHIRTNRYGRPGLRMFEDESLSDLERLFGALDGGEAWISNNDKTEHRKEIECLVAWFKDNNLSLNVSKMKELVIDFRKHGVGHAPTSIKGAEEQMVKSIKFLGVTIINNLSWATHVDATVKKPQECLYFLRRLRKFGILESSQPLNDMDIGKKVEKI